MKEFYLEARHKAAKLEVKKAARTAMVGLLIIAGNFAAYNYVDSGFKQAGENDQQLKNRLSLIEQNQMEDEYMLCMSILSLRPDTTLEQDQAECAAWVVERHP